jgi:hypothetical protein
MSEMEWKSSVIDGMAVEMIVRSYGGLSALRSSSKIKRLKSEDPRATEAYQGDQKHGCVDRSRHNPELQTVRVLVVILIFRG